MHGDTKNITLRIELPAVNDLVAYLNSRDNSQKQIDALTAQVKELTDKLQGSGADLKQAVEANQ